MSNPTAIPGARATLLLSMTMSFMGIAGAVASYSALTVSPSEMEPTEVLPGNSQARFDMFVAMAESDLMKGLDVANLLVSGLLVIASMLLTARRPAALWWAKQALVANLLYSVARAVGTTWFGYAHPTLVDAMFVVEGQPPPPEGTPMLVVYAASMACGALLFVGIYGLMLRLVTRPNVKNFVNRETD